ncbi:hypothetical protein BS17DRAFT_869257 [Gyrodon lividus]|nr:hypothetical protein BS17DRAFT_869257 [Gyrodon lividus]
MTTLSLFMNNTGIFCFVPISTRLVASGIAPAASLNKRTSIWTRASAFHFEQADLPRNVDPFFGVDKGSIKPLAQGDGNSAPRPTAIQSCSSDDTLVDSSHPESACPDADGNAKISPAPKSSDSDDIARLAARKASCSEAPCSIGSSDEFRPEFTSNSMSTAIHALTLLEVQDQLSGVALEECEVSTLTKAFSRLQL